jgi:hypothetical protein
VVSCVYYVGRVLDVDRLAEVEAEVEETGAGTYAGT